MRRARLGILHDPQRERGFNRGDDAWKMPKAIVGNPATCARRDNTLYIHRQFWPDHTPAAERLSFFDPEPVIDHEAKRSLWPHNKVGISQHSRFLLLY